LLDSILFLFAHCLINVYTPASDASSFSASNNVIISVFSQESGARCHGNAQAELSHRYVLIGDSLTTRRTSSINGFNIAQANFHKSVSAVVFFISFVL